MHRGSSNTEIGKGRVIVLVLLPWVRKGKELRKLLGKCLSCPDRLLKSIVFCQHQRNGCWLNKFCAISWENFDLEGQRPRQI